MSSYKDGGLFGIYAGTGPNEVGELLPVVCDELLRLAFDVSEEEVARARAQLKASTLMGLESTGARCEQLAQNLLIYGRPIELSEIIDKIDAVDAGAVRRFAAGLGPGRPTLACLGPIGAVEAFERVAERLSPNA